MTGIFSSKKLCIGFSAILNKLKINIRIYHFKEHIMIFEISVSLQIFGGLLFLLSQIQIFFFLFSVMRFLREIMLKRDNLKSQSFRAFRYFNDYLKKNLCTIMNLLRKLLLCEPVLVPWDMLIL